MKTTWFSSGNSPISFWLRLTAAMSAAKSRQVPVRAEAGSGKRWSSPMIRRTICGQTSPTKPMMPRKETMTAVTREGHDHACQADQTHAHAQGLGRLVACVNGVLVPAVDHEKNHGRVHDHGHELHLRPSLSTQHGRPLRVGPVRTGDDSRGGAVRPRDKTRGPWHTGEGCRIQHQSDRP